MTAGVSGMPGTVTPGSFQTFTAGNTGAYSDDYGVGLRLDLPIGPLRLDYGIPLHHSSFTGSSGKFQFGVGYSRTF